MGKLLEVLVAGAFLIFSYLFIFIFRSNYASSAISITSACAGFLHNCFAFSDGKMKCLGDSSCWGRSSSSESFGGSMDDVGSNLPYVNVGTFVEIEQVSCGYSHTCVRLGTGDMKCLGWNSYGQTGLGVTDDPIEQSLGYVGNNLPAIRLGDGLDVSDIALGQFHSCAKLTGNKVKCFGANHFGQLGQGKRVNIGISPSQMGNDLTFIDFGVGVEVSSVHSGIYSAHNCVILLKPMPAQQRIKCWGLNSSYQLGYGDTNWRGDEVNEMGSNLPLIDLGFESKVKQVLVGGYYTCAVIVTDKVKCWGYSNYGQLGTGAIEIVSSIGDALPFLSIDAERKIKMGAAGPFNLCIVYEDMITLKCLGDNGNGQLGQGDMLDRGGTPNTMFQEILPVNLGTRPMKIQSIHVGYTSTCIIFVNNLVKCFGWNAFGQLGTGNTYDVGDNKGGMGDKLKFVKFF